MGRPEGWRKEGTVCGAEEGGVERKAGLFWGDTAVAEGSVGTESV
jgi:hypothetical protein